MPEECGFGTLKDIIIPPYAISIPRIADLNKDLILGIGNNKDKPIQNTNPQSNNSIGMGQEMNVAIAPESKSAVHFGK